METKGFVELETKIAGVLENELKRVSDNQVNKVELDFKKHNLAVVVKIKNLSDKEVATIKIGNSTIAPRKSTLEQTTVNIKGIQSLPVLSSIDFYAEYMHKAWEAYKEENDDDNKN